MKKRLKHFSETEIKTLHIFFYIITNFIRAMKQILGKNEELTEAVISKNNDDHH